MVFAPLAYPGYNWLAQAVSDLSAANAPSLSLWNQLSALYNVCEVVCVTVVCIGIQRQKTKLLDYSMEKAKEMGAGALAITGNIDFYGKSGFVPAKTKGVRYADDPEADYFLIRELTPGFLCGISGTYKDPDGYFVCEKDPEGFERFDATFPKKEKRKLPGQLF